VGVVLPLPGQALLQQRLLRLQHSLALRRFMHTRTRTCVCVCGCVHTLGFWLLRDSIARQHLHALSATNRMYSSPLTLVGARASAARQTNRWGHAQATTARQTDRWGHAQATTARQTDRWGHARAVFAHALAQTQAWLWLYLLLQLLQLCQALSALWRLKGRSDPGAALD